MSGIEGRPDSEISLPGPVVRRGPVGIGGWLLLVAFGQVLAAFSLPFSLVREFFDPENQALFRQIPLAMYGELALNVALVLLVFTTTVLLFRKSRHFPRVFILECIVGPLLPFVGIAWSAFAISHQLGKPIGELLELDAQELARLAVSLIVATIWIAYALKSKRVRNTFILGLTARDMDGEAGVIETPLLLVIGAIVFTLGASSIVLGIALTMQRGVFNGSIVGGALQVGLALLLLRGSDVARLILALLFGVGVALWIWIAFMPGQGMGGRVGLLVLAALCAGVFWALAFSKRFRTELEINAAKYRKPDSEGTGS